MNFGTLRVFNDDYIDGESGFGSHSHDNMEIVTIVHQGVLTHQDSMDNTGTIQAGEVQYMSAGAGVTHAELNQGTEPIHLYQIWIFPDQQNLPLKYEQKDFSSAAPNILVPVASGQNLAGALAIRSNATIYTANLEAGQTVRYTLGEDRGLFVYLQAGGLEINGTKFTTEDQARITDESDVLLKATEPTQLIAIDVLLQLPF